MEILYRLCIKLLNYANEDFILFSFYIYFIALFLCPIVFAIFNLFCNNVLC